LQSDSFELAAEEIAERDPAMRRVILAIGAPALRPRQASYFAALVRSIAFQQLAGKAAAAIHGRFLEALDGFCTPEAVLGLPEAAFRQAGFSAAKTASIRDLAAKVVAGAVPLDGLEGLSDQEIVNRLTVVRGIGGWTAEMFLIFQLRRPDVWPAHDLGVRRGYAITHQLKDLPSPREMPSLGEIYRPYRTVATWYCWRAAETVLPV
jgi:DNA-3-methyladenine glycosylase II